LVTPGQKGKHPTGEDPHHPSGPCPARRTWSAPGRPHQGRPPDAGYAGRAPARSL